MNVPGVAQDRGGSRGFSSALFSMAVQAAAPQDPRPAPNLAVVLIVDQMPVDYLTRWSDEYSAGLHRLLGDGTLSVNAHHDHVATMTATGHATIATGTIPAHHGIVGNSFYSRLNGKVGQLRR